MPGRTELPVGKARDERRTLQTINGLINGWSNSVGQATITAGTGEVIINDPRCSTNSHVTFTPTNAAAVTVDGYVNYFNGYFEIKITTSPPTSDATFSYEIRG